MGHGAIVPALRGGDRRRRQSARRTSGLAHLLRGAAMSPRSSMSHGISLPGDRAGGGRHVGQRSLSPASRASSSASRHSICCIRKAGGIAVLFSASTCWLAQFAQVGAALERVLQALVGLVWRTAHCIARPRRQHPGPRNDPGDLKPACSLRQRASSIALRILGEAAGRSNSEKSSSASFIGQTKARHPAAPRPMRTALQTRNDSPQPQRSFSRGLLELEALVQALAHEVELRAVDVGQALRIDQHLDAVALEDDVLRAPVRRRTRACRPARAARRLDAQAHADALAALGEVAGDVRAARSVRVTAMSLTGLAGRLVASL